MPRRRYIFDPPERFVAGRSANRATGRSSSRPARAAGRVGRAREGPGRGPRRAARRPPGRARARGVEAAGRGPSPRSGRGRRRPARRAARRGVPGRVADARLGRRSRAGPRRGARPGRGRRGDRPGRGRRRGRGRAGPAAGPDHGRGARSFVERAPSGSSPAGGRRVRCAARRSIRAVTSARGATATTSTSRADGRRDGVRPRRDARGAPRRRDRDRRAGHRLEQQRPVRARPPALPGPGPDRPGRRSRRSTSRPSGSGRSTTSRTGRWHGARSRRGSCRRRSAGTSSRRRSCATARSARAWSRPTSTPIPRSTSWRWSSRTTRGCAGWRSSMRRSTTPTARAGTSCRSTAGGTSTASTTA